MVKIRIAPKSPIISAAAVGATRPKPTSSSVRLSPVATAARPKVVANVNGIANQARPPIMNPPVAAFGLDAIARCQ